METVLWNTEIHKLFVVCNSKNQSHSSDRLGNVAVWKLSQWGAISVKLHMQMYFHYNL